MIKDTWTQDDERKLEELQERKQRVIELRRKPILDLVWDMPHVYNETTADSVTDWMIKHADEFRDALAPFDSGVRVGVAA